MSKRWSNIRKRLEQEFLCEKLRGRVQYFFTYYHNAPDDYGRVAVRIDGVEVVRANPYNEFMVVDEIINDFHEKQNIPFREWDGKHMLNEKECMEIEEEAALEAIKLGKASSYDVVSAFEEYMNIPLEEAINSDNYIYRMLAIMDRRIGKRTLIKMKEGYEELPDWLKVFYKLRFEVENI